MKTTTKPQAVLVTTEFRGVFFGYVKNQDDLPAKITLTAARNCISWAATVGGFLGLAAKGPDRNCKIGQAVRELTLFKITSVTPVEPQAIEAWEKA